VNWAIEIREFDIEFLPRTAIKGQVMANFLAEFSSFLEDTKLLAEETWVACVDGSSNRKRSGAGVMLISLEGEQLELALKLAFPTTNNEAEYEVVVAGMAITQELGVQVLEVRSNSEVVSGHICGEYATRGKKMKMYLAKVRELEGSFERMLIMRVPRENNTRADSLAHLGSSTDDDIEASDLQVHTLLHPSIGPPNYIMLVQIFESSEFPGWEAEVVLYLKEGELPKDK
jgi:ribonuclease HI